MAESVLSFVNSSSFRNQLISRNLKPYSVPGTFSGPTTNINYETNLTVSSVIDSPDTLISTNTFANTLYPLNEFGPEGGFNGKYSLPGAPYPVDSNSGPYNPNDTNLDLINEFFIDAAYIQNIYGPEGGYSDLVVITDVVGSPKLYKPYWDPSSFVTSTYSTYDLVFNNNPTGSNGPLSQDTYLAKIGAQQLKSAFDERIAEQVRKNTIGRVNLDSLQDPFSASLVATGKEPFIEKNWTITQPENPIAAAASFALRMSGTYFPVSTIPGDYFNDTNIQSPLLEKVLNVGNALTGGLLGPILDVYRNPSETFVANTGNGQRSILFSTLDYNKYRPKYSRGILQSITTGIDRLLDSDKPNTGGYYVGSPNAEPSQIDSPANQIPVGPNGRQINTIVYGPQELGILYEGNENKIVNGLKGKSVTDGGGISGQFVWTSPKYKDNAGFKQGVGGKTTTLDNGFESIRADYSRYQSTEIPFKEGSILDQTQRLVESADKVAGQSRLKHVGNAINQVSKVFNDGYKELTKGSQVLSYRENADENEVGIEYCRVFTKDTPYYTYGDLQKTDGITEEGRKFSHSVFDKTYNLNIAPLKMPGSTNIVDNKVKKYMFSIENLAWRTSDRPGYTYDDLPVCERGANGGRVMWFPPYDLTFSDESTPSFNSTSFLGRPEPIYTYKNTTRKGSISWKIIVDHPAVMNTIVQKQLKNVGSDKLNSMMDSFFAGCLKYDLYELGIKFNTIPTRDLYTYQQILNNPRLTSEELGQVALEIPTNQTSGGGNSNANGGNVITPQAAETKNDTSNELQSVDLTKFVGYGFYFDNDCPECKNSTSITASQPYDSWYSQYVGRESVYQSTAPTKVYIDNGTTEFSKDGIGEFFTQVVKGNYDVINNDLIKQLGDILSKGGNVTIDLQGSASAVASTGYNEKLSKRRIDSVKKWLKTKQDVNGVSFNDYITNNKIKITEDPKGEEISIPKTNTSTGDTQTVVNANNTQGILSSPINCNSNVQEKTGNTFKTTVNAEIYSIPAMACRRVIIKNITAQKPPEKTPDGGGGGSQTTTTTTIDVAEVKTKPSDTIKPTPNTTIEQKIKDGISKKVLRHLFSECDYFEVIKDSDPMIYQSIKDKIKHFHPAFHSMTPEGLNSRLTFLNQCVRPGQTIPIIGADGRPKYNDALNTSFGAPPILVLRIGDFYHSKIVPNSMSFSYDDAKYDLNPEGIGIQPMIVKVSMSFDFIGGHGLKEPIEELQNALSFNFYANTEVYDERSTATEDVSERDKYVVEKILSNQPPITVNQVQNQIPKRGGSTIGNILSDTEIDYTSSLNNFWKKTVEYFNSVIDTTNTLVKTTNIGIIYSLFNDRDYTTGTYDEYGTPKTITIYGKPKTIEEKLDKLYERVLDDISSNNNSNSFMNQIELNSNNITKKDIREIGDRLKTYVSTMKDSFITNVSNNVNNLVLIQQDYVQYIRQYNLLLTKTDGSMNSNNIPNIYNLSGDNLNLISNVYKTIEDKNIEFFDNPNGIIKSISKTTGVQFYGLTLEPTKNGIYIYDNKTSTFKDEGVRVNSDLPPEDVNLVAFAWEVASNPADNRFYQVMAQVFYNETLRNELKTQLLNSNVYSDKSKVETAINQAIKYWTDRNFYTEYCNKRFSDEIKKTQQYTTLIQSPIDNNVKYVVDYTFTTEGTQDQKTRINNIYSTNNINTKTNTFDGKIKFN